MTTLAASLRLGRARAVVHRARGWMAERLLSLTRAAAILRRGERPTIRSGDSGSQTTVVESFWARQTVASLRVSTPRASRRQLEWRFAQYPLFREMSGLWGDHDGEVLLDYGCGPGNDVVGFALHTGAEKIIGIDVSEKALALAADRLALHRVDPRRVELIQAHEEDRGIPLEDDSVDYLQSQGVLHHVTEPEATLRELQRVLKPGGRGCVMVYNRDSVWLHLHVAYGLMLHDSDFAGRSVEDAFTRSTDGFDCPISRSYRASQFVGECKSAGFEAEYLGGYLSTVEMNALKSLWKQAILDERLGAEHRTFLRSLSFDSDGYPMYRGMHAGIGGVYRLRRPEG
jgi:ubiquinone/menaquinone biosynthesis C-methylase UbiE